MKRPILSVLVLSLLSCNRSPRESPASTVDSSSIAASQSPDTLARLDVASPDAFIQTFSHLRKQIAGADLTIHGTTLLTSADFFVVNFSEHIGRYDFAYAVAINPTSDATAYSDEQSDYLEVQDNLNHAGVRYNLLIGSLASSVDFTGDGSTDFILTSESSFDTDLVRRVTVVLYDGSKGLTLSAVAAHTDLHGGECSAFRGVKEDMRVSAKAPYEITISREEHIFPDNADCDHFVKLSYEKRYRWQGDGWNPMPMLNGPQPDSLRAFKAFPKKFTILQEKDGSYVAYENCQNGGLDYIQLLAVKPEAGTQYFRLNENEDDVEDHFLAGFDHPDPMTYHLYWRTMSDVDGSPFSAFEDNHSFTAVTLTHDTTAMDLYSLSGENASGILTTTPAKYPKVKCGDR